MIKRFFPKAETALFKKIAFWSLTGIIGMICLGIIVLAATFAILSINLPDVTSLENNTAAQSTQIFDRNGKLLYTIHGEENREFVPIDKISKDLINATVSIEDDQFWTHGGFDIWAVGKGLLHEVFGIGRARGGSTITQQYIKNTFLSNERSYIRKAKELILAIRLEKAYSKQKIMELYLNRIPYGNNAYGIEKASKIYFNKNAKELTLAESVVLASLPQAPSRYNPYGNYKFSHLIKDFSENEIQYRKISSEFDLQTDEYVRGLIGQHIKIGKDKTIYIAGRSDAVLKRMNELGYITLDQRQQALNNIQKLVFNKYKEDIKFPHFVLYVKDHLEQKYGKDVVEQGGLKVYTTLNSDLQDFAEKTIKAKGPENIQKYETYDAASITINPKTGEILSMVGSIDYSAKPLPEGCQPGINCKLDPQVNVALKRRQPGSSFKPIVYSQAFYNGYAPGSVVEDIPTKVGTDEPQDFDGHWLGQISIRKALGQSRNIPAIKAYYLGGQQTAIVALANKMGITSLKKGYDYGYPLAIGSGEVTLMEMANAYAVFANNGKKPELTDILKVEDSNGNILEEWKPKDLEEVMDPQIAYLINNILSDQSVSVGSRMYVDGKMNAAKTGTSTKQNKKDAKEKNVAVHPSDGWIMGYTPSIVTGVWIGNSDNSGLGFNADGYNTAAPIFKDIMTKALENIPTEQFPEPEGIQHITVSSASGKLPGPDTPASMLVNEVFPSFSKPDKQEASFYKVKIDKISGLLATDFTPAEDVQEVTFQNHEPIADLFNWKAELEAYYHALAARAQDPNNPTQTNEGEVRPGLPPTEFDNVHTAETGQKVPLITIVNPSSQSIVPIGNFKVEVMVTAPNGIESVEYYIDNSKKYTALSAPYTGQLKITKFMDKNSVHLLVAKVIDKLGYATSAAIQIKISGGEIPAPSAESSASATTIAPDLITP